MSSTSDSLKVAVLGATSFGLTIASMLCERFDVTVLVRNHNEATELAKNRKTPLFPELNLSTKIQFAVASRYDFTGIDIVFIAVPSQTVRANLRKIAISVPNEVKIISLVKGIEYDSGATITRVIASELNRVSPDNIGVLAGPNLAKEVAESKHTFATLAFPNQIIADQIQFMLNTEKFRIYTTDDVIGVEVGGAYKNIIALAAGFVDAVVDGVNAKAALITRGLHEMTRYGRAVGAQPETFTGLSGMGDLAVTCYSKHSRNYNFGWRVGKGKSVDEALTESRNIVEGLQTARAVIRNNEKLNLPLPIAEAVYAVIESSANGLAAGLEWVKRTPKRERDFLV